ncbi:MAG: ATP-dependent DNA helicase RecG [Bacteroidales bacterium]|nr:ATP-dependent DNA helicase RecG [Bacteroidales bacterium]MBR1577750.1 ATP-dependent DNA helicase RecG [Bacteroidales bacterium]
MGELNTSIQYLSGVGPKRAELLRRELGIETLSDLIHLYPFRYIDRSGITPIAQVAPDLAHVQLQATVIKRTLYGPNSAVVSQETQPIHWGAVKRLSVIVEDASGQMEMVFFKGIRWNFQRLVPGSTFLFFGKPQAFGSRLNIVHPEVDVPQDGAMSQGALTGVYPSTEQLKTGGITGKVMCKLQSAALTLCLPEIQETLPEYILQARALVPLPYALKNIHFPKDSYALQKATYRLKFEELFFLQLSLLKQKYIRSRGERGIPMPKVGPDFHACYNALPYALTGAQQRVIKEIRADMMSGHQMNRLLQGDVGSGKTMVAVLSCLIAIGNGCQACIMAPTEVLAQQHYANIQKYLKPTSVQCALLTGSTTQKERRGIHAGLEDGSIGIIVGTHALLEDNVVFRNLGLAVIDEQHRFGVDQRAKLWAKGPLAGGHGPGGQDSSGQGRIPPHVLVMTATPIPRTLAMTLYGDLDVSVIDEMPPGRKPVQTMCIGQNRRAAMYKFMRDEIARGRQVFVVFPLIFESEKMDLQNLEQGYEEIVKAFPLPDYKVAIVHGQQTNEEKNFNMSAFAAGRAHILVSTTVIEVGVDVPNASVMVIESAQRFGLSQLHQLRGRVGRGAEKSYCILVKDVKTSKEAQQRLDLMCATEDGFEIAEQDMKMRGPGDLEGTQQSGLPISLNIASLAKDGQILTEARLYAERILDADPGLEKPQNAPLVRELRKDKYEIKDYSKIS